VTVDSFDLIIIGSGSGNSIPPHLDDWKIAVVERGTFGGTCLNAGCIPSKMFVLPADLAEQARHGRRLGVSSRVDGVDWAEIRDRVFGRIDPISAGGREYRAHGSPNIELISGTAHFVGDRELEVDGRRISAPKILLAAGARPVLPPIGGLTAVRHHTSETIMRLDRLPHRLGIIGGGFIAAELGHVFAAYGSQVTLYNRSEVLIRAEDDDIARRFTEVFGRRVDLRLGRVPDQVEHRGDAIVLSDAHGSLEVDELLVATGRRPNSDLLRVAAGGIPTTPDGRVVTDETMATPAEGVWAIGDLTNPYQLKHLANTEARVAFWNLAHPGAESRRVDYRAVPHAIFSHPQVAAVGLTEEAATEAGLDFAVGRRDYGGTAYGWALDDSDSFVKVLISADDGRILGAHAIGPQASSIIQPLIQAMQLGTTAEVLATEVYYIHPALTEVVENALLDGLDQLD
jgi:mycothione reductase